MKKRILEYELDGKGTIICILEEMHSLWKIGAVENPLILLLLCFWIVEMIVKEMLSI